LNLLTKAHLGSFDSSVTPSATLLSPKSALVDLHLPDSLRPLTELDPFSAPELLSSMASPSADLYSIGAILYHLVTGQLPIATKGSINFGKEWQRNDVGLEVRHDPRSLSFDLLSHLCLCLSLSSP
jgi:serine/threonine protein kinase